MGRMVTDYLEGEILDEFDKLQELTFGGEEHSRGVDDICKMCKIYIDASDKERKEIVDEKNYENDKNEQKLDRWIRVGTDAAGIVIPLMFYGIWMNKGFKFEESGTYTSQTFRNLFNRFRPTEVK